MRGFRFCLISRLGFFRLDFFKTSLKVGKYVFLTKNSSRRSSGALNLEMPKTRPEIKSLSQCLAVSSLFFPKARLSFQISKIETLLFIQHNEISHKSSRSPLQCSLARRLQRNYGRYSEHSPTNGINVLKRLFSS